FPDALETLAELRARGYLLGIVTNRDYGGEPFLADLKRMGVLDNIQPEHVAISADVGYRKPHVAIFWHALNRLHVPPSEAAMVGDKLLADVYGAQQIGLFTVWRLQPREWTIAHDQRPAHLVSELDPPVESASAAGADADMLDDATRFAQARTMQAPDAII